MNKRARDTPDLRATLAKAILEARKAQKLTQTDLAEKAGTSQALISEVEGGVRNYRIETVERVLEALGLGWSIEPLAAPSSPHGLNEEVGEIDRISAPPVPAAPPHTNSYLVPNNRIVAGDYAGDRTADSARAKVKGLLEYGINHWIDLTRPVDGMRSYVPILKEFANTYASDYRSFPIPDNGVPTVELMAEVLDELDAASAKGLLTYLHCHGGVGRTGTVVGCYLVRHGMDAEAALEEVERLFRTRDPKRVAKHSGSPETRDQRDFVSRWAKVDPRPKRRVSKVQTKERSPKTREASHSRGVTGSVLLGGVAGDIAGSTYEFNKTTDRDFELFPYNSDFTDDSVLTIAVADAILHATDNHAPDYKKFIHKYGNAWKGRGYGGNFAQWLASSDPRPYGSFGNGSAMRVSAVGWAYDDEKIVLKEAKRSAEISHNHPEGIKGAESTALAIFLARTGEGKDAIRSRIERQFNYDLQRTVEQIVPHYSFNETCQRTVPEAIVAFLDSQDFEDTIRKAIFLGGDADTLACIAGSIAEAFYGGIPAKIESEVRSRVDASLMTVIDDFQERFRR